MKQRTLAAIACLAAPLAQACGFADAERRELDDGLVVFYRLQNPPLPLAAPFALQFDFCRAGRRLELDGIKIDARMPAHGHGMNYRPGLERHAAGHYEATGLLFHMPGHWQLVLDLKYDDTAQRLLIDYRI